MEKTNAAQTTQFLDHYLKLEKKGCDEDFLNDLAVKYMEKIEAGEKIENMAHWVNSAFRGIRKNSQRKSASRGKYLIFKAEPTCSIDANTGKVTETVPAQNTGTNYREMIETVFDGLKRVSDRQLFTLFFVKRHTKKRCAEVLGISEDTCRRRLASLHYRIEKIVPDCIFDTDMILRSVDIGNGRQGGVDQTYDESFSEVRKIEKAAYRPQTIPASRMPAVGLDDILHFSCIDAIEKKYVGQLPGAGIIRCAGEHYIQHVIGG